MRVTMEEDELDERIEAAYNSGYEAGLVAEGDDFTAIMVIGGLGAVVGFILAIVML